MTPLQLASTEDGEDEVEFLVKSGANLEAQNDEYGTALQIACRGFVSIFAM